MTRGIGIVYGMLAIVAGSGSSQLQRGGILLGMSLQRLDVLCFLSCAEYQHPRCQRVEGSGMPHLHPLYVQTFRHEVADMCQGPKARHAIGLVDIDEGTFLEIHLIYHCK